MEREKLELNKNDSFNVENLNTQNFVMIEHIVMDSLYFDNIYEKMVYVQLLRSANWHTKDSYPSKKRLQKLCYCGETKLKETIKALEQKKLIEVKERFEGGKQLTNLYVILQYPFELIEMNIENQENKGGRDMTPRGSHGDGVGVASRPRGGRPAPTKEKELKEKDFKEKDLKNDDEEKHLQRYLLTSNYQLLKELLESNGFTEFQIIAIQKKLAKEKILFQLVAPVIEIAIGHYLDGQAKIEIGSIPSFFHHQLMKAENKYKTEQAKIKKQYEEYEKAKQYEPKIKFYDWIAN